MIQIPKDELLDSLKDGYKKYANANDKNQRIKIGGWCNALEAIIFSYAEDIKEEILSIRSEIIKNKNQIPTEIDYDTPSFTRHKIKFPK